MYMQYRFILKAIDSAQRSILNLFESRINRSNFSPDSFKQRSISIVVALTVELIEMSDQNLLSLDLSLHRSDALLLTGLDACNMGQIWALFNGKLPPSSKIEKLEWISDTNLLLVADSAETVQIVLTLLLVDYQTIDKIGIAPKEGPAIWRARKGLVGVARAGWGDQKPSGFKKKQRGGKIVGQYRQDVVWCKETGVEADFLTPLAAKAEAMKEYENLAGCVDYVGFKVPDELLVDVERADEVLKGAGKGGNWNDPNPVNQLGLGQKIREEDVVSSNHLMDLLAKKDERAYGLAEVREGRKNKFQVCNLSVEFIKLLLILHFP